MGGGGKTKQSSTIRYAPYIEAHHNIFLGIVAEKRDLVIDDSPFNGYVDVEFDDAFFGAGYVIANFPSLYDMYGKFMSGLDIETLYDQIFEATVNAPQINELVSAEAKLLDDDINTNIIPRFTLGLRDTNSVMSSSFVVGKSNIEGDRVKSINKFSAELKYRMIPIASERWKAHLEWNKSVIMSYAEIMKLYFSGKMDITDFNYSMAAKDKLWPFTVLEYDRAAIGALQGATNSKSEVAGGSTAAKGISGALSGAAMGAMVTGGNPVGIAAGAALGLAAAFF